MLHVRRGVPAENSVYGPIMSDPWEDRCPLDEEEQPTLREAWHRGWRGRLESGPGVPSKEAMIKSLESASPLSIWLKGYYTADDYLQET